MDLRSNGVIATSYPQDAYTENNSSSLSSMMRQLESMSGSKRHRPRTNWSGRSFFRTPGSTLLCQQRNDICALYALPMFFRSRVMRREEERAATLDLALDLGSSAWPRPPTWCTVLSSIFGSAATQNLLAFRSKCLKFR